MQIELPNRQRRYPSLTSLIDIIFLLLLFFMLSSTFSKYTELDVVGALSGGTQQGKKPDLFIQLKFDGIRINGREANLENIHTLAEELENQSSATAILHVGEKVNSQQLMSVVERISALKIKVTVIH